MKKFKAKTVSTFKLKKNVAQEIEKSTQEPVWDIGDQIYETLNIKVCNLISSSVRADVCASLFDLLDFHIHNLLTNNRNKVQK